MTISPTHNTFLFSPPPIMLTLDTQVEACIGKPGFSKNTLKQLVFGERESDIRALSRLPLQSGVYHGQEQSVVWEGNASDC